MSFGIDKEEKNRLIKEYLGHTIEIIEMEGEPQYSGKMGVVMRVDDIGQLHGSWGGLAVNLDTDRIRIIKEAA